MKRAFLFPGQGSQFVGMGKDIYDNYEEARFIYNKASEISGINIKKLCFEGPEEELNKTENTQLAILVTSLAMLEILKKNNIESHILVGLSLGEYTALIYAGIISFEDGIKLIKKRGYYMQNMLPTGNYSMAAVIGLDSKKIEETCKEISQNEKFVVAANYNYNLQTVISGEEGAIDKAIVLLKDKGAKRVIKLNTSGPFHTVKLENAMKKYSEELENVKFNLSNISNVKIIKNIDGNYYDENTNIKEILAKHIISPVRFDKAIKLMQNEKIDQYIEIGPGKVLTGFVKKDNKESNIFNINSVETLNQYLEKFKEEI